MHSDNNLNDKDKAILNIQTKTWSRDSHGLFDFENKTLKTVSLDISSNSKIMRKKNDVKSHPITQLTLPDETELFRVNLKNNKFYLSNTINYGLPPTEENITILQDKLWYVIKSEQANTNQNNNEITQNFTNQNDLYDLKMNDIIKLGRVKLAVIEIKIKDQLLVLDKSNKSSVFEAVYNINSSKEYEKKIDLNCKICLSNENDENNPMINLCKCSGSLLFVHFFCLNKWMASKMTIKENEKKTVQSYNMKSFNCEICKTPYPLRFKYNDNFFELIESTRPNCNYIVLESLNQMKDNNNYKSIHVITLNEGEKILLGRGHDCDVRINDISVSRTHSYIMLNKDKIYLHDFKSKFGTLVLMQKEIEISENKMSLQIGRTLAEIKINVKKDSKQNIANFKIENNLKLAKTSNCFGENNNEKNIFDIEEPNKESNLNIEFVDKLSIKKENLSSININDKLIKKNRNPSK